MLTILVIEIKEGKNAVIYHYLLEGVAMAEGHVCGGILPRNV
jgi:hypothetical protein